MKIAIISTGWQNIFTEEKLEKLKTIGEVSIVNDQDVSEGKPTEENIKATIKDADIAITSWGTPKLNKDILDMCPNLKLIMHAAGTVKPIVCDEVWERGIRVTASAKPLGIGVAETALAFALSACKNIYELNDDLHNGGYASKRVNVKEFYELTVGVIGAGFVGRHFIKLVQNFGVDVILYDPFIDGETAEKMGCRKVELEELFKLSDVVSIHAPNIPATRHMVNAETLKLMKKDAILINTARGAIVDAQALYEHMAAGNLKYALLDVYDPEPLAVDSPLRTLKNIILTPHIAGLWANGKWRIGAHSIEEIERFLNGERLECEITKAMLETIA